ncbi:transmembrane and coiled-coil domain-containing protein 6-like isoform X3 [Synchiropus splendidus]|uniref:transmembrane and coiled-coil domain-containing protein 6-like isoform X3 n=2 Tax=Synchiropus splendidus TaxID=270530 RepID=UPI00237EB7BD|nr:transmembrane and coiled-coil domain-containing protein 6-like isoform X3 [Synchiropus splendidus]
MWRLAKVRHKSGRLGVTLEEFKLKRREQERALRQARRDNQLVSRRLLLSDDEEHDVNMDTNTAELDVVSLLHKLQHSSPEREIHMRLLTKALRDPSVQLSFVKQENSVHLLVGFLSGSDAQCRLQSVRCLHELSHSPHPNVAPACLPATPYLLTYLSGQSTKFTGNFWLRGLFLLWPPAWRTRDIIPQWWKLWRSLSLSFFRLKMQLQNQCRKHLRVFVLAAQLLLNNHILNADLCAFPSRMVLASRLPSLLLSVLNPDPEFSLGPAIECAWCLHYIACSCENNKALLTHGTLTHCSSLLVTLGEALVNGNQDEGLELLLCPLLRIVGNLLSSCPAEELAGQLTDSRLVVTLCSMVQSTVQTRPSLARESVWVLNNLTAFSADFCSALLTHDLVHRLIQLLSFSQGINTMVLRVLANAAFRGKEFCITLTQLGLLTALLTTLKMTDKEMVSLSLDLLFMLLVSSPQVAEEFVKISCLSILEALQYNSDGDMRRKATYLLEHHLLS